MQPNILAELMLDRERAVMQREDLAVQLNAERESHRATWADNLAVLAAERAAHRSTRADLDAERRSEDDFLDQQILELHERRDWVTERREWRDAWWQERRDALRRRVQ